MPSTWGGRPRGKRSPINKALSPIYSAAPSPIVANPTSNPADITPQPPVQPNQNPGNPMQPSQPINPQNQPRTWRDYLNPMTTPFGLYRLFTDPKGQMQDIQNIPTNIANTIDSAIQSPAVQGTPASVERIPKFTPEVEAALDQILPVIMEGLSQGKHGFAPIAEEARTNFEQRTVPMLAERFNAQFGPGSQRSSAFPQILGQSAVGLEKALASLQSQHALQRQEQLGRLFQLALTPRTDNIYNQRSPGIFEQAAPNIFGSLGNLGFLKAASYLGLL